MSTVVNIAEAKTQLSALVDRAATGEEIVITRNGKPLARLVPLAERVPRPFGIARHWQVPDELFLEPTAAEEFGAAEGAGTDEFGISGGGRQ